MYNVVSVASVECFSRFSKCCHGSVLRSCTFCTFLVSSPYHRVPKMRLVFRAQSMRLGAAEKNGPQVAGDIFCCVSHSFRRHFTSSLMDEDSDVAPTPTCASRPLHRGSRRVTAPTRETVIGGRFLTLRRAAGILPGKMIRGTKEIIEHQPPRSSRRVTGKSRDSVREYSSTTTRAPRRLQ